MCHFVVCNVRFSAFVSVASNKVLVIVVLLENVVSADFDCQAVS